MFLTFKWKILVTIMLFCFEINLITMIDRSMKIKSLVWLWTLCTGWICNWFSMALRFRWRLRYIWEKKLKIVVIKFYKIIKILRVPWLVNKQYLIAPISPWEIEVIVIRVTHRSFHRFTSVVKLFQMLGNHSKHKK